MTELSSVKEEEKKSSQVVVESADYATFKGLYPRQRFDEPDARPLFERLNPTLQRHVIRRLKVYKECDRWKASLEEDDGQYIPMASNWLAKCEADPPPRIRKESDIKRDHQRSEVAQAVDILKALRKDLS